MNNSGQISKINDVPRLSTDSENVTPKVRKRDSENVTPLNGIFG